MPTITQFEELVNPTNTTITAQGNGWLITSNTNGNSIYLPKTGYFQDEENEPIEGYECDLWTSDWLSDGEFGYAYCFSIDGLTVDFESVYLELAMPVRPVMKKQTPK